MVNRSRGITFLVSMIIWVLMTGLDWQHLIMGVLVCFIVSVTMGDMFTHSPLKFWNLKRYCWFFICIFVFVWECIKANIDVACRVLNPKLPINPGIVKIKTNLKTETAITFLANFITLTPGTLTVDVDKGKGYLYIHWIDVKTQDVDEATRMISEKFEKILKEVFE